MSDVSRIAWRWSPAARGGSAERPPCGWQRRGPTSRSATPRGSKEAEETVAEIQAPGPQGDLRALQRRQARGRRAARRADPRGAGADRPPRPLRRDQQPDDHSELTYELWRETIDVNLNGAYLVVFAVKDEMIARGFGRIVLISSVAAPAASEDADPLRVVEGRGDRADALLCRGVRAAQRARQLRGPRPDRDRDGPRPLRRGDEAESIADTPMGRIGQPEEIASVIRFLLSEESSFMTGQTIVSSGGRFMVS